MPPPLTHEVAMSDFVAAFLLVVSSAVCTRLTPSRLCWRAFACLFVRPSTRGCSACTSVLHLPRRCSLRLLLFYTCPPLCTGALKPMIAWVWRDVRSCDRVDPAWSGGLTASSIVRELCQHGAQRDSRRAGEWGFRGGDGVRCMCAMHEPNTRKAAGTPSSCGG